MEIFPILKISGEQPLTDLINPTMQSLFDHAKQAFWADPFHDFGEIHINNITLSAPRCGQTKTDLTSPVALKMFEI